MPISYAHLLPTRRVNLRTGPDTEFVLEMDDEATRASYLDSLRRQFVRHRPSIVLTHQGSPDGQAYGRVLGVREFSDEEAAGRGWLGGGFFLEVDWEDWVYDGIRDGRFRFVSGKFVKNYQSAVDAETWPLFLSHVTLTPEPVFDLGQTELSALMSKGAQPRICEGEGQSVLWSAALSKEAYTAATTAPAQTPAGEEDDMDELIEKLTAAIEALPATVAAAVVEAMQSAGAGDGDEGDEADGDMGNEGEEEAGAEKHEAEAEKDEADMATPNDAAMSKIVVLEKANRAMEKELRTVTRDLRRKDAEAKVEALFAKHEIDEAKRKPILEQVIKYGDDVLTLLETAPLRQEGKFAKRQGIASPLVPDTGEGAVDDFWAEVSKRHKAEIGRDHVALLSKDRKPPRTYAKIAEDYAAELGRPMTDFE